MSVIMTMRVKADPAKFESLASQDPERGRAITEKAKGHGLIAHRFYGSEDGQVMVIDEWPDPESFQQFFEDARSEIEATIGEAGVTEEPEVTFWRKLETGDDVGWGA